MAHLVTGWIFIEHPKQLSPKAQILLPQLHPKVFWVHRTRKTLLNRKLPKRLGTKPATLFTDNARGTVALVALRKKAQ